MAKIRKNAVVHGASGGFGDLIVFRQLADGTTILTQKPGKNPNRKASEKQKEVRKRWQQAILYAKGAIKDPVSKALYETEAADKPMTSAYNVAVADFFHAPSIESVDVSRYAGQPGDQIEVMVTDDFMVKEVQVAIYNPDGSEADKGMAVQDDINSLKWIWTAQTVNDVASGDKVVVTASDVPGQIAEHEMELT